MRTHLILAVHVLTSFGVMLGGPWLGQAVGGGSAERLLAVYMVSHAVAAGAIASMGIHTRVVLVVAGCLLAAIWSAFCSLMAMMAATGNWM